MRSPSLHLCRGLTLIELAAVAVLVGLFAVMMSLSTRGLGDTAALRAAQSSIEQAWGQARLQARTRHRRTALVIEVGSSRMGVALAGGEPSTWIDMHPVKISRACFRGDTAVREGRFTLWVSPAGSSLPWAVQLARGNARSVMTSRSVTWHIQTWPDRALEQVTWNEDLP